MSKENPIQIRNRWTDEVIYSDPEAATLRQAVLNAVRSAADLRAADLRAADLSAADLSDADLRAADLSDADLSAANLRAANLSAADLSDANLSAADLSDANLSDADLSDANLSEIRKDFEERLALAPGEVLGLLASLRLGRIDGSTYEGACACFVGTIANIRQCSFNTLGALQPDSNSPTERWFLALRPGHTPETSPIAKITEEWIIEWLRANRPQAVAALEADDALDQALKDLAARRVELAAKEAADGLTRAAKQVKGVAMGAEAAQD